MLSVMTLKDALQVAKLCAVDRYPPTNRNVLVRAMMRLQNQLFDEGDGLDRLDDVGAVECIGDPADENVLRNSRDVIAAWMLVLEGYSLGVHNEATQRYIAERSSCDDTTSQL